MRKIQKGKGTDQVSIFDKSHDENIPAETAAAEVDLSNSLIVEAGEETNPTLVGSNKVEKDQIDGAEEEHIYNEHAVEEVETGLEEAKEGEGEEHDVDDDNGEEEPGEYDDDNSDDIDVDYDEDPAEYDDSNINDDKDPDEYGVNIINDDEDPDEYDDINVNDDADPGEYEGNDVEDGGDSDGEDFDEDDVKDDVMEEEEIHENTKLENNDNTVEENDDNQRNIGEEGKQEESLKEGNEGIEVGGLNGKVKIFSKESERKNQRNTVEKGKRQENVKEENEKREGGSLKKKVKILRKESEGKKVITEVSNKVAAAKTKVKHADAMVETDQENGKKDNQDKEVSNKQKLMKLSSGKTVTGGSQKLASKRDDKLESSQRKKSSTKVKSMGMIFMCSSKTKRDCYHYKVLGLPASKRDIVGKIYKGMRLFLYDVDLKLMYGIYKATGRGGYNIQPKAFNSQFPSQVRFMVLEDCLPLAEEKFKKVIQDNYYTKTKFNCQLTSQQVNNLCKLFHSATKGSKSKVLARRPVTNMSADQGRSRARVRQPGTNEKRRYRKYSKRAREVVSSPVAPVPRLLVPPAAATPSCVYDRLGMDVYRQDLLVPHLDSHRHPIPVPEPRRDAYRILEHRDVYRGDPLLDRLDLYRQDMVVERDLRIRDDIGRRDPYISYRDRPEHRDLRCEDDFGRRDLHFSYRRSPENLNLRSQDEIERRDPYISYRERPAYRSHLYDRGPPAEHDSYLPISRSADYRSAVATLPEYRSSRRVRRYY